MIGLCRRIGWLALFVLGVCAIVSAASQPPGSDKSGTANAEWWSFKAPQRPAVPAVKNSAWVRNPIDNFVLAQLERLAVEPSPPADRVTLARRLSLDLLGLPPTPAEIDQFVNDESPDAYEQLVDRLLASPHFGERWGRHWLDLARYADSDGYEKDSPRPYAYLYRNWVIDALNRDLPFDQFTIEQIAGDLLPNPTLDQKIATGFHRNTLTNKEGGVDQEEYRNKANVDRVSTTATVWLGLTLACAECHNHKYDPLTQRDFYSLFAFFNTSQESEVAAPQPAEIAAYERAKKDYDAAHSKLTAALTRFETDQLPGRLTDWERGLAGKLPTSRWVVLDPVSVVSAGGATPAQQPDGSIRIAGKSPPSDTYTIEVRTELRGITAFRLEVLPDDQHPAKGPGRVKHGNFVLNEFQVKVPSADGSDPRLVTLQNATADFSQDKYAVAGAIDGNPNSGWAIAPQFGQRHVAVFETKDNLNAPTGGAESLTTNNSPLTLLFTLDQQYGTEHTIGRLRLSATTEPRPVPDDEMPDQVAAVLRLQPDQRDERQRNELAKYYRSIDAEWKKLNSAVAEHTKKAPPPPATKAATIVQNSSPPPTHVHIRGDFLRKGDPVEPNPPALFANELSLKLHGDKPDRLDLARWLVDPANPLTARVTVNRMWQYLFGRPLVGTANDFGTRGEQPTHPELLDWLACEFMAPTVRAATEGSEPPRAWSQKEMIRLIVGSSTYRQSSRVRSDLADRDPTNTLLARQNRYRLEAEVVRDLHLAASGLLTPAVGGPSVRPPQPSGISDLTYAGSAKWVESSGPDRYRRGMYTWFQRTSPYPMLMTFDSPDGVVCVVRRERSNTPLQALTLLNDAVFTECAQQLARRTLAALPSETPIERIQYIFRICMSRAATANELPRLVQLHAQMSSACRANPDMAKQLAGSSPPENVDSIDLAAWTGLSRAVLNLDEFVTRE